jgi:tetratricopeptide (TPR) repeat protein
MLKETVMPPNLKRRSRRWLHFSALLAAAIVLLLLSVDYSNRLLEQTQSLTLFCFDRNFWMTVSRLPAAPVDLGALYRGNLWMASDEGVLRFDGTRWSLCPEALKTKRPAALAATAAGVWVLDASGNLSHYDGSHWSMESLAGRLPGVTWGRGAEHAALAAGADGTLWVLWNGLWHYSEDEWQEVRPGGQEVIGAKLVGESAGHAWLARGNEIQAVTPAGRVEARFRVDLLDASVHSVYKVIASPGNLWLATPSGFVVYDGGQWRDLGAPPHTGGLLDAAPGFDGGLFVIGAQPPAGLPARLGLALPLLMLSAASLLLLIYLLYYMYRIRRDRLRAAERPAPANAGPGDALWIRNHLAVNWTREALKTADYQGALRKLRSLALGFPSRQILLLEAAVFSLAGRAEEAERCCRRAAARTSGEGSRFALDRLGAILTDRGRYDEARQCLEDAIRLDDGFDLACTDLAELLLIEGRDPERALDLVERAIQAKPSSASQCVGRQMDAETMAVRAWALAASGKRLEAEVALQRALGRADQRWTPVVAGIYWRVGMASACLGDRNAARSHFRNAAMMDPQGKYGNLSRLQLDNSAWGVSA